MTGSTTSSLNASVNLDCCDEPVPDMHYLLQPLGKKAKLLNIYIEQMREIKNFQHFFFFFKMMDFFVFSFFLVFCQKHTLKINKKNKTANITSLTLFNDKKMKFICCFYYLHFFLFFLILSFLFPFIIFIFDFLSYRC